MLVIPVDITEHVPFLSENHVIPISSFFVTAILKSLCKEFLSYNVSAILYLMNYEQYGRSTASAQYFLQLAGYLGIPVIAWNADNSGLERRASQSSLQLQLAPSLEHQTAAMLSILERYKWHQFSVVTSLIAGHDDFIQAVRERVSAMQVSRFLFFSTYYSLRRLLTFNPLQYVLFEDINKRVILGNSKMVRTGTVALYNTVVFFSRILCLQNVDNYFHAKYTSDQFDFHLTV